MSHLLLTSPLTLNIVDLGNEHSQPIRLQSKNSMFHLNESSCDDDSMSAYGIDDEVDRLTCQRKEKFSDANLAVHTRLNHDEDYGLRYNSKRIEFAQKYLFKSGFKDTVIEEDN